MIEATRLQAACARLLKAISAPELLGCSDGDRPGRGAGEAGRDLTCAWPDGRDGSVVEADMQGFFDHRDQAWRLKMLGVRLEDRACLGLIRTWLKAGGLETAGRVIHPDPGTPQGGVRSPVLANVYGHDALALWCETVGTPRDRGEALISRDADGTPVQA